MKFYTLKTVWTTAIVTASALMLTACAHKPLPTPVAKPYRAVNPAQRTLLAKIRASGVQVIRQGDVVSMIIPTDRFFESQTTELYPNKVRAVRHIADFMKRYITSLPRPEVAISGYTDTVFARRTRKQLSKQYAEVIASYLWHFGISKNLLHARGYGAAHPIASNRYPAGSHFNRRVVITMK